jgi:hypothetical protein
MNDHDLERALRSQQGPREEGYTPTQLPRTLGPARAPGPSRLMRIGILVPAALAGALAVAVVGSILSGSGPGIGGTNVSPEASASPVGSGADSPCGIEDVTFSAEAWGAAAGSRGTTVLVTLATGRYACTLPTSVIGQIADADGMILIRQGSAVSGGSVVLQPGAAFAVGVAWSNWCGSVPAAPIALSLKVTDWASWAPISAPAGGADPVPPCMGAGQRSSLSLTELQPQ